MADESISSKTESSTQEQLARPVVTTKKSKLKSWHLYQQRPSMRLSDAVALAMDKAPKAMLDKARANSGLPKRYVSLLRTARYASIDGGSIKVHERIGNDDGSEWIIDIKSFVKFALDNSWKNLTEEFISLGNIAPSSSFGKPPAVASHDPEQKSKLKASVQFCNLITKLLIAISYQAGKKNERFNIDEMHGTKKGFQQFASKCNSVFRSYSEATFDDYIGGFCKFLPGSRPSDFYDKLFDGEPPQIK